VDDDRGQPKVTSVTRTELFEALRSAEVREPVEAEALQAERETDTASEHDEASETSVFQRVLASGSDETGQDEKPGRFRARVVHRVGGSKVACLVELRGFEPLTPSMRRMFHLMTSSAT
jgi:hypothetical protein